MGLEPTTPGTTIGRGQPVTIYVNPLQSKNQQVKHFDGWWW